MERERKMGNSFVWQLELVHEFSDMSCRRCQRSISNKMIRDLPPKKVLTYCHCWGTMKLHSLWRHRDVAVTSRATDSLAWFSFKCSTMAQCGIHTGWWIYKRTSQHCQYWLHRGKERERERKSPNEDRTRGQETGSDQTTYYTDSLDCKSSESIWLIWLDVSVCIAQLVTSKHIYPHK